MNAIAPASSITQTIYPDPTVVKKMFVSASINNIEANLPFILQAMAKYNLTSVRQLIGILATIAVEVPPFRPIEEYGKGGGRHGNFFGRGYVQLTWEDAYRRYKAFSGLDVVAKPELLLVPEVAADAMMWYWTGGSGGTDIRPYAEKADWNNVRSIVNAGSPGKIGICWGVDVFLNAVRLGIANLTDGLDKELLGSLPGNYGLGAADGGLGAQRNFMGLNPNSTGDAIAMALNLQQNHCWRTQEFHAQMNVAALKDLLRLRTQKKFSLSNFGEDLDEEYKVESLLITGGQTLEMEIYATQKDPSALDPLVFRQDANSPLINVTNVAPGLSNIPNRIHAAAQANFGKSSVAGPNGGAKACAWVFGRYCALPAGLRKFGAGPYGSNAVLDVVRAILAGRGSEIPREQAINGDVWTDANSTKHIGIVWEQDGNGAKTILSNSSSRASFRWEGSVESMERYYGGTSRFFRITA